MRLVKGASKDLSKQFGESFNKCWINFDGLAWNRWPCKRIMTRVQARNRRMNVLLVENGEDFWNDLYERLLGRRCRLFAVDSARDGRRMISLVPFDLVICDHVLKDGDGIGFFSSIAHRFAIPLRILIARRGAIDPVSDAIVSGIDDIAEKPLSVAQLIASLSRRLCLAGYSLPRDGWPPLPCRSAQALADVAICADDTGFGRGTKF